MYCPYCGGDHGQNGICLGASGHKTWYKCRACGIEYSLLIEIGAKILEIGRAPEKWNTDRA